MFLQRHFEEMDNPGCDADCGALARVRHGQRVAVLHRGQSSLTGAVINNVQIYQP